jgi:hypothetical protein
LKALSERQARALFPHGASLTSAEHEECVPLLVWTQQKWNSFSDFLSGLYGKGSGGLKHSSVSFSPRPSVQHLSGKGILCNIYEISKNFRYPLAGTDEMQHCQTVDCVGCRNNVKVVWLLTKRFLRVLCLSLFFVWCVCVFRLVCVGLTPIFNTVWCGFDADF